MSTLPDAPVADTRAEERKKRRSEGAYRRFCRWVHGQQPCNCHQNMMESYLSAAIPASMHDNQACSRSEVSRRFYVPGMKPAFQSGRKLKRSVALPETKGGFHYVNFHRCRRRDRNADA